MSVRQRGNVDVARRTDLLATAGACIGFVAIGALCVMWSFHTNEYALGRAAFFAGIGIANGGVIFTLLAAYRRGERRGDW
jgi:hypothetical protein